MSLGPQSRVAKPPSFGKPIKVSPEVEDPEAEPRDGRPGSHQPKATRRTLVDRHRHIGVRMRLDLAIGKDTQGRIEVDWSWEPG